MCFVVTGTTANQHIEDYFMSQNIFTSNKQFHQISQLISDTFDIKTSKVEHKLSNQLRYKNANALLASINKEEPTKPSVTIKNVDSIVKKDLETFEEINKTFKSFIKKDWVLGFNLVAPTFITLFLDNVIVKDKDLLALQYYVPTEEYEHEIEAFNNTYYYITKEEQESFAELIFVSTLVHVLSGYHFSFEDLKTLNHKQITELIKFCDLEQYNVIAQSFDKLKIDKKDEIAVDLNIRYAKEINKTNANHDPYEFDEDSFFSMSELFGRQTHTIEEILNMETPPVGFFHHEEVKYHYFEETPVEHLGEHAFTTSIYMNEIIKKSAFNLFNRNQGKQVTLDENTFSIIKHLKFAFESGLHAFINYPDERKEFDINNLMNIYEDIADFIPDHLANVFLAINPDESQYHRYYQFDENTNDWNGISIFESFLFNSIDAYLYDIERSFSAVQKRFKDKFLPFYTYHVVLNNLFKYEDELKKPFNNSEFYIRKEVNLDKIEKNSSKTHQDFVSFYADMIKAPTNGDALKRFMTLKNEYDKKDLY